MLFRSRFDPLYPAGLRGQCDHHSQKRRSRNRPFPALVEQAPADGGPGGGPPLLDVRRGTFLCTLPRGAGKGDVEADGTLAVKERIRTKAKAERRVVALMHQLARDGDDYADKVFISNADCLDDARAVSSMIETQFPKLDGPVHHFDVGATIGCHTGPGTVALFFWGAPRT